MQTIAIRTAPPAADVGAAIFNDAVRDGLIAVDPVTQIVAIARRPSGEDRRASAVVWNLVRHSEPATADVWVDRSAQFASF
ncbi:MAG: hypothetical protein QOF76_3044 [Solirubrobacteraceae bacterium]|jgi:hypothetical protein|nr:hypothetical protein [Solirubrobacteraceae bacterium]